MLPIIIEASKSVEDSGGLAGPRVLATHPLSATSADASRFHRDAKRLMDVVGAGLGLLFLIPIGLVIAAMIRLDSKGPIFFRQKRLGLGGREFRIWKFRTMVVDAEQQLARLEAANESDGGALFKIRRDPRITRVGRFLRRTSLDELPQLLNVLKGEMSVVGPRPLPLRDCDRFKVIDPGRFARRMSVPPGLTGLWQVSGRSELGSSRLLELDLEYIENWNLAWDLRLIAKTVSVVLLRRGSY